MDGEWWQWWVSGMAVVGEWHGSEGSGSGGCCIGGGVAVVGVGGRGSGSGRCDLRPYFWLILNKHKMRFIDHYLNIMKYCD